MNSAFDNRESFPPVPYTPFSFTNTCVEHMTDILMIFIIKVIPSIVINVQIQSFKISSSDDLPLKKAYVRKIVSKSLFSTSINPKVIREINEVDRVNIKKLVKD